VEEKPRQWHEVLSEALWAYRVSKRGTIKVTPFELVYGQEVVLPVEINVQTSRVMFQDKLLTIEYRNLIIDEIDDLSESRLVAL
jgi:hypothetical protein